MKISFQQGKMRKRKNLKTCFLTHFFYTARVFFLPRWWNGRHGGLKILCLTVCGFKSRSGHQIYIKYIAFRNIFGNAHEIFLKSICRYVYAFCFLNHGTSGSLKKDTFSRKNPCEGWKFSWGNKFHSVHLFFSFHLNYGCKKKNSVRKSGI